MHQSKEICGGELDYRTGHQLKGGKAKSAEKTTAAKRLISNMPRIDSDIKLDFKDVLVRPKRSTLRSRSEVNMGDLMIQKSFIFSILPVFVWVLVIGHNASIAHISFYGHRQCF